MLFGPEKKSFRRAGFVAVNAGGRVKSAMVGRDIRRSMIEEVNGIGAGFRERA